MVGGAGVAGFPIILHTDRDLCTDATVKERVNAQSHWTEGLGRQRDFAP
jgi:hypothetical protein